MGIEVTHLNIIKLYTTSPQPILHGEKLKAFPLRSGMRQGCPLLPLIQHSIGDFTGGAVVKNPSANAGDTGSSPELGRSHMPRSN